MNILLVLTGFIISFIIVLYCERKMRRNAPRNNVHFYVARDKNGNLYLYLGKPFREYTEFHGNINKSTITLARSCHFNIFGLNEKDYANLEWEDEPVEVFVNMKN